MKKSFMTRVLATGLSVAMAFSLSTATNLVSAEAATTPAMASKTFNLKVDGAAKSYKANAATRKSYKITKATVGNTAKATVKVNSSKKSIKVTPGSVAGSTVVTVTFKNNKTKKSVSKKYRAYIKAEAKPVEEALAISSAVQKKASAVELTFNKELTDVKASQFTVVRADDVVRTVKAATPSTTDKKVVTLEVYESLTDAKEYKVTYKPATGDAVTASFTATNGKAASIALSTDTVTANVATEIKYIVKDAAGIELSETKIGSLASNIELTKTFSNSGTDFLDGDKLTLKEVGNTVELSFKYRTYDYKDGEEVGSFTSPCKVTAVADTSTVDNFQYGIGTQKPNFDKDTLKTWLALGDKDRKVFFRIKDSNKTDVTSTVGYTVESNDPSVILVAGDVKDGAVLTTVKEGSAVLVIKNAKGETVKTLPITVKPQRKLSTFNLSQSSVRIATKAALGSVAAQTIDVTAKDQYGDDMTLSDLTASCNKPEKTAVVADADAKTLTIGTDDDGTHTNKGDYTYTIKATAKNSDDGSTSIEKPLAVTAVSTTDKTSKTVLVVQDASNAAKIRVKSSIDTTISKLNKAGNSVQIVLAEEKNGVVIQKYNGFSAVTVSGIIVEKVGGEIIAQTGYAIAAAKKKTVTHAAIDDAALQSVYENLAAKTTTNTTSMSLAVTASAVSAKSYGNLITKNLGAGTYRVTYKLSDGKSASANFTIKDTQDAVTAKVLKTTYEGSVKDDLIKDKDYIVYYVGSDAQLDSDGNSIAEGVAVNKAATQKSKFTLSKVNVDVKFSFDDGSSVYMHAPGVAVNTTFTTANGGDWQK